MDSRANRSRVARIAVMCSLVSTEMGVAGCLVDRSDWSNLPLFGCDMTSSVTKPRKIQIQQ